ncbi:MAG: hypothetical protein ACK5KO_10460 [Arachnia sp.]
MVGTLIKHEWKRTRFLLGLIFGVATVIVAVASVTMTLELPMIWLLGFVCGLVGIIGLVVAVQLSLAIDYWRSSYGRIGYFTQTLPVPGTTIFWVKMAYATVVSVVAFIWSCVLGDCFGWFAAPILESWGLVFNASLREVWVSLSESMPGWFVAVIVLFGLFLLALGILMYFGAASIGSESRFNKFGMAGPVVTYAVLYLGQQILGVLSIFLVPLGLGVNKSGPFLERIDWIDFLTTAGSTDTVPFGIIPALLLLGAALAWRTHVSWKSKISLR